LRLFATTALFFFNESSPVPGRRRREPGDGSQFQP
jgi:hypothetical protein